MTIVRITLLAWATLLTCIGPAHAEPAVTPELVCRVQNAIRWREPAWTQEKCNRVASAILVIARPMDVLAIAVNESDMRERALAWYGTDVVDAGLMGVRCVLSPGRSVTARGFGPRSAGAPRRETAVPAGRCQNGPARGFSVAQLQDAETNIAVGAAILASKGSVARYHSGTPSIGKGYETRIAVLVAALSGESVEPKRIRGKRLRKLVEQISATLRQEGKS